MPRLSEVGPGLLIPIRGIVFDKDGTLADLDSRWVPFFRQIIKTVAVHGQDPQAEQTLAATFGVGVDRMEPGSPAAVKSEGELLAIAVEHLTGRGWSEEVVMSSLLAGVNAASFGPLVPLGAVAETMAGLEEHYRLGVATSDGRKNTLEEFDELGITEVVSAIHCGDDGNGVKPDPQVLWHIAEQWQMASTELLFVGDSLQDLETARAAGCTFVAVDAAADSGGIQPDVCTAADAWVASIDEILDCYRRSPSNESA